MAQTPRIRSLFVVSCLFLGGCAADIPTPVDPMTGLGRIAASSQPENLRSLLRTNTAVVLTVNTRNLVGYQKSSTDWENNNSFFQSQGVETSSLALFDASALAAGPVLAIKKYFPQTEFAADLATAKKHGAQYAIAVDITEKVSIVSSSAEEFIWDYKFIFIQLGDLFTIVGNTEGMSDNTCVIPDGGPFNPSVAAQAYIRCDIDTRKLALAALSQNMQAQFSP